MSSGISSLRNASICHCGEPYQTESVPQKIWSWPRPLINEPIIAAQKRGLDVAETAKLVPTSEYTLFTPYFAGIAARSVIHLILPVRSNSARQSFVFSWKGCRAE